MITKKIQNIARLEFFERKAEALREELEVEILTAKQELATLLCPFHVGEVINLPKDELFRGYTKGQVVAIKEGGRTSYYLCLNPVKEDGSLLNAKGYSAIAWGQWEVESANADLLALKKTE